MISSVSLVAWVISWRVVPPIKESDEYGIQSRGTGGLASDVARVDRGATAQSGARLFIEEDIAVVDL